MNVLVIAPHSQSAVDYHRLIIPFKNIDNVIFSEGAEYYNTITKESNINLTREYLINNNIGIVWFSRNISPVCLNPDPIYRLIRSLGIKIVIDIDDNPKVDYGSLFHRFRIDTNLQHSEITQIKAADYVCVTHEHLRTIINKEYNYPKDRIIVAANGIDPKETQYDTDFSYKLENIFWQGSVTHHNDLKQLSEALNEMQQKIYIAGYNPESHKDITDYSKLNLEPSGHIFDDNPSIYDLPIKARYKHVPDKYRKKLYHWEETGKLFKYKQWIHSAPVTEYMKFYQNKGICVIPLEKTRFTVCKSNLKMLEAGWAKKPVIASGIHPYNVLGKDGVNCEFAYNKKAWIDSISYILENPNYADDLRFQLHEDVKENFMIDKVNQSRIDLINKIKK